MTKAKSAKRKRPVDAQPHHDRPVGRPTKYTAALAKEICDLVANRVPLAEICEREGMPNPDTIYTWKRDIQEFSDNYARAREHRADARQDRIDDIVKKMMDGTIDPQVARVAIDAEKWQMGKEKPKSYGDKLVNEVTGRDGGPLVEKEISLLELARRIAFTLTSAAAERDRARAIDVKSDTDRSE